MEKSGAVFVGVGNELRGDDSVGVWVVKRLRTSRKFLAHSVPESFVSKINSLSPTQVVVVDATDFGGAPGELRVVSASETGGERLSTHQLPLRIFAKFFECPVFLVGLQPKNTGFGESLSQEVEKKAGFLVEEINRVLGR